MGEKQDQPFQLSFNSSLRVDFQGSRVTSDSGLLLVRELDERLGLSSLMAEHITDDRRGKNTQLPLPDLLRQSIYSRLAGYEDVNDAERLSQDPTFRLIGSEKIWERGAALTSRLHWFETEVLSQDEHFDRLSRINREMIAKAEAMDSPQRVVLDMDSTEIPVYGQQEQSVQRALRVDLLSPAAAVQRGRRLFGEAAAGQRAQCGRLGGTAPAGDRAAAEAGQASGASGRRGLRQARDLRSAGGAGREVRHPHPGQRQPGARHRGVVDAASGKTEPQAGGLVQRPSLSGSKLEDSTTGGGESRVPCWGVVPTSGVHRDQPGDTELGGSAVLQQARDGGAVDQGRQAGGEDDAALLPSVPLEPSPAGIEPVGLQLEESVAAAGTAERIENWSLTSLQQRLVKTGGRLVKHARYYWLLLAEAHLNRRRFGAMLGRIALLPLRTG
jgi:hypothetical protein